jgi:CubicO group peptidase (beta-lactamase class C family)
MTTRLDSLFALHPEFSGVALIAENGKPVFHKAFGYRDVESKILNDTTTLFELASVSKAFTSMIILMLKEEGLLNCDDPLDKFLPGLPYANITIRHLLTHTSGLPDYQAVMDQHWDKTKAAGNEDIIEYLKLYHPDRRFAPGEKYEYSNTGYVLLGSIAEKASGKDFIAMCRDRIFSPLGMQATNIRSLQEKAGITNFSRGYIFVAEKNRYISADSFPSSNYIVWLGNRRGPGRVSSTTSDMLKWDRALYGSTLVSKETLKEAFSPSPLNSDTLSNYGFGWMISKHPNLGAKIWHTGSNPGYATLFVRFIDADKTIIILSNNAYNHMPDIAGALESILSTTPNQ